MCICAILLTCNLFSFYADINWLPGSQHSNFINDIDSLEIKERERVQRKIVVVVVVVVAGDPQKNTDQLMDRTSHFPFAKRRHNVLFPNSIN